MADFEMFAQERELLALAFPKDAIQTGPPSGSTDLTVNSECAGLLTLLSAHPHWGELTTEKIRWTLGEDAALLSCLSPNLYPRVLPAFLVAAMDCITDSPQVAFLTNCELTLMAGSDSHTAATNRRKREQFASLSAVQVCAVVTYLRALANLEALPDEYHAKTALCSFWEDALKSEAQDPVP